MNIILLLPDPLAHFTAMYIMQILNLPKPVFCNTITEVIDESRALKSKIIITHLDLYKNEIKAFYSSPACDGYTRVIIFPARPSFVVDELPGNITTTSSITCDVSNLYEAIQYCNDPWRYLLSVCLVGISYEDFFDNPAMAAYKGKSPMLGIKQIKWPEEIVDGRLYLIIDKNHKQIHRRIHASGKKNHLRLEADCKLTPSLCKGNRSVTYIATKEILGILEITAETISFI